VKAVSSLNEIKARQKQAVKSLKIPGCILRLWHWYQERVQIPARLSPGIPLFSIVDINPMRVIVAVPESDIGQVKPGQATKVNIPALDSSFTGTVRLVSPVADPSTRSYTKK